MTTLAYGKQVANTNNTTAVTILSAPSSSHTKICRNIVVYNKDTVSATVTIQYNANSTIYILLVQALASGTTLSYTDPVNLAATTDSLEIKLSGAVTTNQLDVVVSYADIS
jgi:hypothetical protein